MIKIEWANIVRAVSTYIVQIVKETLYLAYMLHKSCYFEIAREPIFSHLSNKDMTILMCDPV